MSADTPTTPPTGSRQSLQPSNAVGLRWRAAKHDDVGDLVALLERIRKFDQADGHTTEAEVRRLMGLSWVDLAHDTVVGFDEAGALRAWGLVMRMPGAERWLNVRLLGGVDPGARGCGVGRRLLGWQLRRAEQHIDQVRGGGRSRAVLPARITCGAMEHEDSSRRLYEAAGMRPARWFITMRRPLETLPPEPVGLPGGLRLVTWSDDLSEPVRLAHNEVFADHWGSEPLDTETWESMMLRSETFRPGMSFVALDQRNEVVGYAANAEHPQEWEEQGFSEGHTNGLGVRRGWRGRGVASTLLDASARAFREAGHHYAGLDVDSDSPTGAVRLYAGVGYQVRSRRVVYARESEPPSG